MASRMQRKVWSQEVEKPTIAKSGDRAEDTKSSFWRERQKQDITRGQHRHRDLLGPQQLCPHTATTRRHRLALHTGSIVFNTGHATNRSLVCVTCEQGQT